MPDPMTGSCQCNAIRYRLKSGVEMAANCHCNLCKKMTGGAFSSIAVVDGAGFEIVSGKDLLTAYQITENASKHFCSKCGSPVYNLHIKFPGKFVLAIGTFDEPAGITPAVNIHCENMLPWVPSIMSMTNFEENPPG